MAPLMGCRLRNFLSSLRNPPQAPASAVATLAWVAELGGFLGAGGSRLRVWRLRQALLQLAVGSGVARIAEHRPEPHESRYQRDSQRPLEHARKRRRAPDADQRFDEPDQHRRDEH